MAVSYNGLWKLLIDKNMYKKDLAAAVIPDLPKRPGGFPAKAGRVALGGRACQQQSGKRPAHYVPPRQNHA